jgi:Mn-dependent DtxR family transcriptional regulator
MSDLSRQLSVSNANMTGMTKRLNKEGLIDKKRSHQIEEYMVLP